MATKDKTKTSRSPKKKPAVSTPSSTVDASKKKAKPAAGSKEKAETPEQTRLRTRSEGINSALQNAFGTTKFDSGAPPAVKADLAFDGTRLTELAALAKEDADKLTSKNTPTQYKSFTDRLERLNFRLQQAQATADRLKQVKDTAAGLSVELTHSDYADAWNAFNDATKDGDLERANGSLGELEARLKVLSDVLVAYNAKSGQAPVKTIPMGLRLMAGKDMPLDVLRRGLALVPDRISSVDALRGLLATADPPSALPSIVPLAAKAGVSVGTVLTAFKRPGNATGALNALRAITDAGQTADFFITGQGSQRWEDLAYIGAHNIKAWPGGSQDGLHLGPLDAPPITFDELRQQTIRPADGRKHLLDHEQGQDPAKDRYLGNKPFVNDGIKRGVVLPRTDNRDREIRYFEYDIRPYKTPGDRGGERLVVGNGRWFYTADHYKNFVEIL